MSSQDTKSTEIRSASASTATGGDHGARSVTIEIRGQSLQIRSDRDPAFVQRLARHIDETVEELCHAAPSAPYDKILMLASMTVAEELFETRRELRTMERKLQEHTETMCELIDQVEEI